jgi:hypothetical protein
MLTKNKVTIKFNFLKNFKFNKDLNLKINNYYYFDDKKRMIKAHYNS